MLRYSSLELRPQLSPSIARLALPDLNIGPQGPIQPALPSQALVRVTPAAPRPITSPDGSPLGRSGLDVRDLLGQPDLVVVRSRTPALALGIGLEQARGALIRNQPTDALMALDEVWEGARGTETGWYIRGSSLALLGLPAEAARVAGQLLDVRPQSVANRFLLSLAKLTQGDISGARLALADAVTRRPGDALLIVQEALLLARQGNRAEAEQLLRSANAAWPDHAAIAYGRAMMRQALKDGARVFDDALNGMFVASRTPGSSRVLSSIDAQDEVIARQLGAQNGGFIDIVNEALARVGARLPLLTSEQTAAECRALLISLSAGGTLAAAVSPARAFIARSVLGSIIDALQNSEEMRGLGWDAKSIDGHWEPLVANDVSNETAVALRATVRALVLAVRDGRTPDADELVRRLPGSVGETKLAMLREFAGIPREAPRASGTPGSMRALGDEPMLLAPLRLGLGLLPVDETLITRRPGVAAATSGPAHAIDATEGWGPSQMMIDRARRGEPSTSIWGLLGLLAGAVGEFALSHPILGFIAMAGAGWLALRRWTTFGR